MEIESMNEGIKKIDDAIDRFIITHFAELRDADSSDNATPWRDLTSRLLAEAETEHPHSEVYGRLRAYVLDRVTDRRSDFPHFTGAYAEAFINEHHQLPEGKTWVEYLKRHADKKPHLNDELY